MLLLVWQVVYLLWVWIALGLFRKNGVLFCCTSRKVTSLAPNPPLRWLCLWILSLGRARFTPKLNNKHLSPNLWFSNFYSAFFPPPCCPECCLKSHNDLNNWWLLYEIVKLDPSSCLSQPQVIELLILLCCMGFLSAWFHLDNSIIHPEM